jgi:hypothetical protein
MRSNSRPVFLVIELKVKGRLKGATQFGARVVGSNEEFKMRDFFNHNRGSAQNAKPNVVDTRFPNGMRPERFSVQ